MRLAVPRPPMTHWLPLGVVLLVTLGLVVRGPWPAAGVVFVGLGVVFVGSAALQAFADARFPSWATAEHPLVDALFGLVYLTFGLRELVAESYAPGLRVATLLLLLGAFAVAVRARWTRDERAAASLREVLAASADSRGDSRGTRSREPGRSHGREDAR